MVTMMVFGGGFGTGGVEERDGVGPVDMALGWEACEGVGVLTLGVDVLLPGVNVDGVDVGTVEEDPFPLRPTCLVLPRLGAGDPANVKCEM